MRFIIFLLLLGILSLISVNYSYAEEISVKLELNKDTFEFGDPIILHTTVGKIVPNTPLELQIFKDGFPIRQQPQVINPELTDDSDHQLITLLRNQPSGIYEIFVYYGVKTVEYQDPNTIVTDSLGSNSISIKYNSELSADAKFLEENYMVDEFDIGTLLRPSELQSYSSQIIDFCEIDFCYDTMIAKQFDEGGTGNHVRAEIFEFKDESTAKTFFAKLLSDPLHYDPKKIEGIDIREGFECGTAYYVSYGYNEYAIVCYTDNKLFKIFVEKGSTSFSFDFREQAKIFADAVSEKIIVKPSKEKSSSTIQESNVAYNYSPTHIENFPDSTKSPQYYLDRYNNEASYKEWFDSQFPDTTLSEILAEQEPSKIPDWVKNTMQWYLEGKITEDEMISAISFLVKEGIVKVN